MMKYDPLGKFGIHKVLPERGAFAEPLAPADIYDWFAAAERL